MKLFVWNVSQLFQISQVMPLKKKDIFDDFILNHHNVIIGTDTSQLRYMFGEHPLTHVFQDLRVMILGKF